MHRLGTSAILLFKMANFLKNQGRFHGRRTVFFLCVFVLGQFKGKKWWVSRVFQFVNASSTLNIIQTPVEQVIDFQAPGFFSSIVVLLTIWQIKALVKCA